MKSELLPTSHPLNNRERRQFETRENRFRILETDDGTYSLFDVDLDESYHSAFGAASETHLVYLVNSGVAQQIIAQQIIQPRTDESNSDCVRVLEYGFGTGLNFLATAALAASHGCPLEYVAYERSPLPVAILKQLQLSRTLNHIGKLIPSSSFADHAGRAETQLLEFLDRSDCRYGSELRWQFVSTVNESLVHLTLRIDDATQFCPQVDQEKYHAIYFDAFSPKTTPELWTRDIFQSAYKALSPSGRLVTYCVNGAVRKVLVASGFSVEKSPGPSMGKREVLIATKPSSTFLVGRINLQLDNDGIG